MSVAAGHDGLGLTSWRIGPWSLVWGALAFGLATISWLSPQTEAGPSAAILAGSILRALWMIAVALAMLTVGYCAGPYRLAADRARRATERLSRRFTDEIRGPMVPWALLGVGLIAQFGFAALTGHFGYVGNVEASVSTASGYGQYLAVAGRVRAARRAGRRDPRLPDQDALGLAHPARPGSRRRSRRAPSPAARRASSSPSLP